MTRRRAASPAERIRLELFYRGLTQKALADHIGVSAQTITRWLGRSIDSRGTSIPPDARAKIAEVLCIPEDQLRN